MAWEHSMPQMHVGSAVRTKLGEIERRATNAAGWEPPILATEAGRVRQMLGDYVAVNKVEGRDTQVRWLQLEKVGAPSNGTYPIAAWAQHSYRNNGKFEALFDAKTRVLSGSSVSLGKFSLSLEGQKLVGSGRAETGTTAPVTLAFDKVLQREVSEIRAQYPPARMRAKAASVIRLLYLSAEDCPYCRKWERDHLQSGKLTGMPEFKQIEFLTAKRPSLKARLKKSDLPGNVPHLFDKFESDKGYAPLMTVVPSFVLLVDDEIRVWRPGAFLDSPIYPMMRAAVREKTGSGG